MSEIFLAINSKLMAEAIKSADSIVVYAAPGIDDTIAEAIVATASKIGHNSVTVILDCDDKICRLGYGTVEAIRKLKNGGINVRQSSGLRIGILICDKHAWTFAPLALSVEDYSDQTFNAVRLLSEQAEAMLATISPRNEVEVALSSQPQIIGKPLPEEEIKMVEKSIAAAPPLKFDLSRQVQVFLTYIQYVELSLHGCSVSRRLVEIPQWIVGLAASEDVKRRLRTTFNLIDRQSKLSDKKLQEDLKKIRNDYLISLGRPWGNVILRANRDNFDKDLEAFKDKLKKYQSLIEKTLQNEIDESIRQIVDTFFEQVIKNPPDDLGRQIPNRPPTTEEARRWLEAKLKNYFPKAEKLIKKMELVCLFRGVTYETIKEPGFEEALKKKFQAWPWEKLFQEFRAAEEEKKEIEKSNQVP